LSEVFEAHCVDSWVLANWQVGGHIKPDNTDMLSISPIIFHRRQLHMLQFAKKGKRKRYGGTRSLGFKRGSLVKHSKYGVSYIGGSRRLKKPSEASPTINGRISLHSITDGKRLCQNAKPTDIKFLSYNTWTSHKVLCAIPPTTKVVGLLASFS
jgi:hypothetical protein